MPTRKYGNSVIILIKTVDITLTLCYTVYEVQKNCNKGGDIDEFRIEN